MAFKAGDIVALSFVMVHGETRRSFVEIVKQIEVETCKEGKWIVTGPFTTSSFRIVFSHNLAPLTQAEQHDYVLAKLEGRQGMIISKDL